MSEKEAYISELSDMVVRGVIDEGEASEPSREGMVPTTPSLGAVTTVYDIFFLADVRAAWAWASWAWAERSWLSVTCHAFSLIILRS